MYKFIPDLSAPTLLTSKCAAYHYSLSLHY